MTYFEQLRAAKDNLVQELESRGVEGRYLSFGGEGVPITRIITPTDARSEFLANRAMGDWAENTLSAAIQTAIPDYKALHYGDSDRMAAGEDGFKEFYASRLEDVRVYGKRPDLLIVPSGIATEPNISHIATADLTALVGQAIVAIEVRSSKFDALHYMRVRREERAAGRISGRETPSFTVKIEDLKIVYRWLERYKKPQLYCQVFFDSIFAINFLSIFSIIGSGGGFSIETPAKSQEKATIMIPITSGVQIARFTTAPHFEVEHKVTRLGRHDAYVKPVGGTVELDSAAFKKIAFA